MASRISRRLTKLSTVQPLSKQLGEAYRGALASAVNHPDRLGDDPALENTGGGQDKATSPPRIFSQERPTHPQPERYTGLYSSWRDRSGEPSPQGLEEARTPRRSRFKSPRARGWGLIQQRLQQSDSQLAAAVSGRHSSKRCSTCGRWRSPGVLRTCCQYCGAKLQNEEISPASVRRQADLAPTSADTGKERHRKRPPPEAGFGASPHRVPGIAADQDPQKPKQWTLQRILETHKRNVANIDRHRSQQPSTARRHVEESITDAPGQPQDDVAKGSDGLAVSVDTNGAEEPSWNGPGSPQDVPHGKTRLPTKQRLQSEMESGMEVFHNARPRGHRWVGNAVAKADRDLEGWDWDEQDETEVSLDHAQVPDPSKTSWANVAGITADANNALVKDLAYAPSIVAMLERFEAALAQGVKPHRRYVTLMVKRCGSDKQVQVIWRLIGQAQLHGLYPCSVWYKVLASTCGLSNNFYSLREVLPAYLEAGLPLSKTILESIIAACGRNQKFDYAWDMVYLMEAAGFQPNIYTVNALLSMYGEGRQPEIAEEVFAKSQSFGMKNLIFLVQPNAVTWGVLAKAWGRVGNVAKMRAVLAETRRAGLNPPLAAWAAAVAAHASRGDSAGARQVIEDVKAQRLQGFNIGNKFVAGMHASLITAYSRAGDVSTAEATLRRAMEAGMSPSNGMYCAIMWGHTASGNFEACQRVFEEAAANGVPLGRVGHKFLVEAAMQAWSMRGRPSELLDRAIQIFDHLRQHYWGSFQKYNSAAPEGTQLDLHTFGPWSAQLMLLQFLQATADRLAAGWTFPVCNMTIITGRGSHSRNPEQPIVRDVTLRFLQSMFSPHLGSKNDGLVVVRRWELVTFLSALNSAGHKLDVHTFKDCFVEMPPFVFQTSGA